MVGCISSIDRCCSGHYPLHNTSLPCSKLCNKKQDLLVRECDDTEVIYCIVTLSGIYSNYILASIAISMYLWF